MNEELKRFAEKCADDIEYASTSQEFSRDDRIEIGRALYNLGYRKSVWHKVSDKLPKKPAYYYCYYKGFHFNSGEAYIGKHEMFWNGEKFITDWMNEVIAWTQLPEYKEA